jgi:hypothetical protein
MPKRVDRFVFVRSHLYEITNSQIRDILTVPLFLTSTSQSPENKWREGMDVEEVTGAGVGNAGEFGARIIRIGTENQFKRPCTTLFAFTCFQDGFVRTFAI